MLLAEGEKGSWLHLVSGFDDEGNAVVCVSVNPLLEQLRRAFVVYALGKHDARAGEPARQCFDLSTGMAATHNRKRDS